MEVPKPRIVQQTWGNSIAQAIQRERMMQHEKKIMDQELEYKKARDLVNDQKWNKEFDIKESMAKTQNDIMKEQALKMGKMNEQLQMQNDQLQTQLIQKEKIDDLKGWQAKDTMAEAGYQKKIDALELQASKRGGAGREASDELARMRKAHGLGGAMEGGWWDYMMGTGGNENQGLAQSYKEAQPGYVGREEFASGIIDQLGGNLTSESYRELMGTGWNQANQAASMPDASAINYVNQANAPQMRTVQQMYQNQQPVAGPQQPQYTPFVFPWSK